MSHFRKGHSPQSAGGASHGDALVLGVRPLMSSCQARPGASAGHTGTVSGWRRGKPSFLEGWPPGDRHAARKCRGDPNSGTSKPSAPCPLRPGVPQLPGAAVGQDTNSAACSAHCRAAWPCRQSCPDVPALRLTGQISDSGGRLRRTVPLPQAPGGYGQSQSPLAGGGGP